MKCSATRRRRRELKMSGSRDTHEVPRCGGSSTRAGMKLILHPSPGDPDDKQGAFFQMELQHINDQLKQAPEDFTLLIQRLNILEDVDNIPPQDVGTSADQVLVAAQHELDFYPPIP